MAGSLLDVIQTRMKLIGTRTQIYIPPLYYSIEFILLYHQMHEDNLKSNSREKNVQFNTIWIYYLYFFLTDLPEMSKTHLKTIKILKIAT